MLQVRLLGSVQVTCDGRPVVVGGRLARSLLAVLALSPRQALSAEVLVQLRWGEKAPLDPKASVYTAVRRLRILIGQSLIRTAEQVNQARAKCANVPSAEFPHQLVDATAFAAAAGKVERSLR